MAKRNFVRKKIKSLTLGEKLQTLRKDRRLRVQDLSRKINVRVEYIEALESGKYDKLPMRIYIKGFVKSYAQFFGVPEDVLLSLFDREYAVYQNIYNKDVEEEINKLSKIPRFVITPKIIIVTISFFVLVIVGIYLYFSVDNFISSPWIVIESPVNASIVYANKVVIHGKTKINSHVFINEQQVFVDQKGVFDSEINLTQGINVIKIRSVNKFDKESVVEIVVNAIYEVPNKINEEKQKHVQLIIKSRNKPIWINVIADNNDVYNDTLQVNKEEKFEANENIKITTSSGFNTLVSSDDGKTFKPISKENGIVRDWEYKNDKTKDEDNSKN